MSDHVHPRLCRRRLTAATAGLAAAAVLAVPAANAAAQDSGADTNQAKAAALHELKANAGKSAEPASVSGLNRHLSAAGNRASVRTAADPAVAAPPSSSPALVAVTGTSGAVTATVTSSAPYVIVAVDSGTPAAPVAVTDGSATVQLTTWGWTNGTHSVAAADCGDNDPASCNTAAPTASTFDVENTAPQVTAPTDGETVTGGFTITATSDGGGIRFLIDDNPVGFDGTAPYSFSYTGSALSAGQHTLTLQQCSADGSVCNGPTSDAVTITSDSLHPRVVSVSPSPFSPNGDRYKDTSTLTFSLPDTEKVSVSVQNAAGTATVRGPVNLRTLTRGNHAWTWNGRTNSNGAAASGTYRFVVSTTATVNGATVKGLVWRSVVLDNRGPSLTGLNYGGIVYPVRDGYKDTLTLRFRLGEHAATHFTVRDGHGHVVRTITAVRNAGQESFTWNGRNSRNRTVAAGNYTWQLTARDVAGNSSGTARHKVVVSGKRLVNRSVNIVRNGDSFIAAGGSDQSCAEADTSLSAYTHGVWLANACYTGEIAASIYQVSVPAAIQYTRMTVSVGGFASVPPTTIIAGFGRNGATGGDWGFGNLKEIQSSDEGWYTLASRNAAGYVSGRHKVAVSIAVTDDDAPCDFDIAQYEIHLTYKVLA